MPDDAIKTAEKRGYAKGYAAGARRKHRNATEDAFRRKRDAAWNRAFLAALPACIEAKGWSRGDKEIRTLEQKTRLARDFADEAVKHMRVV